jgi:hypothetical protein
MGVIRQPVRVPIVPGAVFSPKLKKIFFMETQDVVALKITTLKGSELHIGKMNNGFINVFCNFNPIRKIRLMQRFNQSINYSVISIMDYQNGTGGLAIKVNSNVDYSSVIKELETIFKTEVE